METETVNLLNIFFARMWGLYWDTGKENGNYYSNIAVIGIMENGNYYSKSWGYWENGQENGNYYSNIGVIGRMDKKMETTI